MCYLLYLKLTSQLGHLIRRDKHLLKTPGAVTSMDLGQVITAQLSQSRQEAAQSD